MVVRSYSRNSLDISCEHDTNEEAQSVLHLQQKIQELASGQVRSCLDEALGRLTVFVHRQNLQGTVATEHQRPACRLADAPSPLSRHLTETMSGGWDDTRFGTPELALASGSRGTPSARCSRPETP